MAPGDGQRPPAWKSSNPVFVLMGPGLSVYDSLTGLVSSMPARVRQQLTPSRAWQVARVRHQSECWAALRSLRSAAKSVLLDLNFFKSILSMGENFLC